LAMRGRRIGRQPLPLVKKVRSCLIRTILIPGRTGVKAVPGRT
jgi:hypothetical protein